MSYTITQARDAIVAAFESGWTGAGFDLDNIKYTNRAEDKPDDKTVIWCRFRMVHAGFQKGSLTNIQGQARYDRNAILTVQLFTPYDDGLNDDAPQSIVDIFEGGISTLSGIWFRNVTAAEVGNDGVWYQANITADIEYDQIK